MKGISDDDNVVIVNINWRNKEQVMLMERVMGRFVRGECHIKCVGAKILATIVPR